VADGSGDGGRQGVLGEVLAQVGVRVERESGHRDPVTRPLPRVARTVPVELDAVALGVVEVERLAHEVVGRARKAIGMRRRRAVHRGGESGARLEEDRRVEEARLAGASVPHRGCVPQHDGGAGGCDGGARTGVGDVGRAAERDRAGALGENGQPHGVAVVGGHEVEVGDVEGHRAHRQVGGTRLLGG